MGIIDSSWAYKKRVTIKSDKVSVDETDITCFISVIDPDFQIAARNDGGDFRITTEDGTIQLPLAVIGYDSRTGNLSAAFKADFISASSDTNFYIYYGNPAATLPAADSPYGSEAAFDSSYAGAYFSTSNRVIKDFTSNARHLISTSTVERCEYQLDTTITGAGRVQGCAYDGSYYYIIQTNGILKRSTWDGPDIVSNPNPINDVNTALGTTATHSGDGTIYNGYLYFVTEKYNDCTDVSSQAIVRFNTSDLTFDSAWDISAEGNECAGLCIDPQAGAHGVIYIASYCADIIAMYDLETPSNYLGLISLVDATETTSQGIDILKNGNFVLFGVDTLLEFQPDGTSVGRISSRSNVGQPSTEGEGGFVYDGDIFWSFYSESSPLVKLIDINGKISLFEDYFFRGVHTGDSASLTYTLPDTGTIQCFISPEQYFNYNSIWDNSVDANKWEAWTYKDGRLGQRIGTSRIYDLDNLGIVSDKYLIAFGWTKDGTNVDTASMVNGITRDSGTETWVDPGATFYLNGGNSGNDTGKNKYYAVFLRNIDLAKNPNLAVTEYNNVTSPSTFIVFGNEESNAIGTLLSYLYDSAAITTTNITSLFDSAAKASSSVSDIYDSNVQVSKTIEQVFDSAAKVVSVITDSYDTKTPVQTDLVSLLDTKASSSTAISSDYDTSTIVQSIGTLVYNFDTLVRVTTDISDEYDTRTACSTLCEYSYDARAIIATVIEKLVDSSIPITSVLTQLYDTVCAVTEATPSTGTLTPETIDTIATAVWSKMLSSGFSAKTALITAATESTKARKMQTNNAEVAEDGSQSIIYDDDGVTPLVTFAHPTNKRRERI